MANSNLTAAKNAKNDEFYTQLSDISKELSNYKKHFKDKVVLCNCDDPEWSNFWIYLHQSFKEFGLKKLMATHYNPDGSSSYLMEYDGSDNQDDDVDIKNWRQKSLKGNGDFRSDECIEILKEADIVITNPPFSLFREYIAQLIEYDKKFLILGNMNAVTYKEIFPLIRDNKIWPGYSFNKTMEFIMPDTYVLKGKAYVDNDGKKHGFVPGIAWFTNLDIPKRHESLLEELPNSYFMNPSAYTKYDNYSAINVDKIKDIPYDYRECYVCPKDFAEKMDTSKFENITRDDDVDDKTFVKCIDTTLDTSEKVIDYICNTYSYNKKDITYYNGVMGVPITYLDRHTCDEFEILGSDYDVKEGHLNYLKVLNWTGKFDRGYINNKRIYSRLLIKQK